MGRHQTLSSGKQIDRNCKSLADKHQISLNDVKTFEAMIEGLEITARVVAQYSLVEILYLKGHTEAKKQLQGQVTILYAAVLRYLCRAGKYYSHNTASKYAVCNLHKSRLRCIARTFVNAFRPPELDDALKQITDQEALVCRQADLVDTESTSCSNEC